jgi:hypothetical protein
MSVAVIRRRGVALLFSAAGEGCSLQTLRELVQAHAELLLAVGIRVEDRAADMVIDFRQSTQPDQAIAVIEALLRRLPMALRTIPGLAEGTSPDSEPVFAAASAHRLTVQVGAGDLAVASAAVAGADCSAQYVLEQPGDLSRLLIHLLGLAGAPAGADDAAAGLLRR